MPWNSSIQFLKQLFCLLECRPALGREVAIFAAYLIRVPPTAAKARYFKELNSLNSAMPLSEIYRSYIACLNRQDWKELKGFVDDVVEHNGRPLGLSGYCDMLVKDFEAIPDLVFYVDFLISAPPRIAARLLFNCSPKGEFLGLKVDGRKVSFAENVFYEFEVQRSCRYGRSLIRLRSRRNSGSDKSKRQSQFGPCKGQAPVPFMSGLGSSPVAVEQECEAWVECEAVAASDLVTARITGLDSNLGRIGKRRMDVGQATETVS